MRGFSLLELLVVLGIVGILGSVVVSGYQGIKSARYPEDAAMTYRLSLLEASSRARTMDRDSAWGVKVLPGEILVFKGVSYAARDTTQDKRIPIASTLTLSAQTEVVFAKFSGTPSGTSTTTFSTAYASSSAYVLASGAVGIAP